MADGPINVCVAGATGWTGRAVAEAVNRTVDLMLTSAVARSAAGQDLGTAWGADLIGVPVFGRVKDALDGVDVLVDYTSHSVVRDHAMTALSRGVHVVIGTSGLTEADFRDLDQAARKAGCAVVAAGNFSVTAAMAQAAALLAARHLHHWEIIDYASATKPDAPSGTARELAERLGEVGPPDVEVAVAATSGSVEARGATIGGAQVHSLRLPSFVVSTEVVFAETDERLSIRHDAGSTPVPYVAGTLIAIREAPRRTGVVRGLDTLLLEAPRGS
jgi:4-hydroxy-tetrahydrodipicolinate reductase